VDQSVLAIVKDALPSERRRRPFDNFPEGDFAGVGHFSDAWLTGISEVIASESKLSISILKDI